MASIKNISVLQGKNTSSRYRGLIWSVAVFLTLIAMLMVGSIWLSAKIRSYTLAQLTAEHVNRDIQTITQNLFNLKLSYGEDPNSPHIQHALKLVKENKNDLTNHLNALLEGGDIENEGGKYALSPLTEDGNSQRLQQFKSDWEPLARQIDTYLAEATSPLADSSSLDLSVMSAQNINEKLQTNINGVLTSLNNKISSRTAWLGWIQTAGVVIALGYFLVFVFYFLNRLRDSDARVNAARKETDEIMNTVSTGLFLLDKDLNIGSQYSRELENLIGQSQLAGRNLVEVLGNMISQEDLNTTHGFIGQLYNPRVKERLIGSLNPLTRQAMTVTDRNNNTIERYLDFKFNRVYHDGEISRILVNVSDVTDAVLLERKIEEEREQNDLQLEMLSTILRSDRQMIDDFIRNTQKHNISINNTLKTPGERQAELRNKIDHIFREAHSLKGEAYALNLHGFTVIAENIENELKKLQAQSSLSGENFLGLAVHLEELMNLTQTIEDLVNRLGNSEPIPVPQAACKSKMSDYYGRLASDVAERNNKLVDFVYSGIPEVEDEQLRTTIHEIAVQLLRNAVVHGIEVPAVRQAKRKLEAGHVRMSLRETESNFVLSLEDDGNGIDYDAIRAKAVELGKYSAERAASLSTKELLMLMFSSGFSTVAKATGDAGRGVGLDVIKDRVNAIGGKINISTSAGAYTRFTFTFPKKAA
ncbi:ATP-binding protein [Conchiformibius steedae DSM 2580]|uniref:Chemotaxis protein CheA n=1 Tax=Conchiformibius steedae DSM 2580 TaxID=1121352 RepID=A0AAE9KZY0_9NEIS|nr:ATP-binding protein [Conchiformibius steedae]QMT32721.1 sensor histidine kinase [Conchiformibius steedae]URD67330.1 ATP-binding protein [Conchiformibius steedae DSM 2580]